MSPDRIGVDRLHWQFFAYGAFVLIEYVLQKERGAISVAAKKASAL